MNDDATLIHAGRLIALHRERVDLPDGTHTHFDIVKHPGGAVIAAFDDEARLCVLKQWRHAVQKFVWELPAGCLESGEAPLVTAQRELEEEAGVTASDWTDLGEVVTSPGFSNEILYFYRASGLRQGSHNLDPAEQLEVHWLSLPRVQAMAREGDIVDAKTLALLYRLTLLTEV